jgi:hypothetical protein
MMQRTARFNCLMKTLRIVYSGESIPPLLFLVESRQSPYHLQRRVGANLLFIGGSIGHRQYGSFNLKGAVQRDY